MDPPPFAIAGSRVNPSNAAGFNEVAANGSALKIDPGHDMMEYFIKGGPGR